MDHAMPAGVADLAQSFQHVPVALIDDNRDDPRHIRPSPIREAHMRESVRRRGVLQPIGVRPAGDRYEVAFGGRRLRASMALQLETIPAVVRQWTDAEVKAVAAAENMQREPMHPIDVWLAVRDLVDQGFTIAEAAAELGLGERESLQMDRLGRLHPELLKLAEIEMPRAHFLRQVANAPAKQQAQAAKQKGMVVAEPGGGRHVEWHRIAAACTTTRILRRHALFDTARHAAMFAEDLFAEPDDPDRFYTTDVARFMLLQQTALQNEAERQRQAKRRIQVVERDPDGLPVLPKGWRLRSTNPGDKVKPKRTECIYTCLRADGSVVEVLAYDVAAEKAADAQHQAQEKQRRQQARKDAAAADAADKGTDATAATDDDAGDGVDDAPAARGVTLAGQVMIAQAKQQALQDHLRSPPGAQAWEEVMACLLLALAGRNVKVAPAESKWAGVDMSDLVPRLIDPAGHLAVPSGAELLTLAGEALARMVAIDNPRTGHGSGPVAEWIGHHLAVPLPRLDTPEFLRTAPLDMLRLAAVTHDVPTARAASKAQLLDALAGKLPDWRPEAAAFGAPAPRTRA